MHEAAPDNPFWAFSVDVYGRDGVAPACLALQDRHGLDVNLLLCCAWAGSLGQSLDQTALARLVAVSAPWQREVIVPLRSLRRMLKTRADLAVDKVEILREKILSAELQAEAGEQQLLYDAVPQVAAAVPGRAVARVAAGNCLSYYALCEITLDEDDIADLTALLSGALPDLMPLEAVWLLTAR